MDGPVLLLILLNFGAVGLLTRFFFRRTGRLGWQWWATATPQLLCPLVLIAAYALRISPIEPSKWAGTLYLAAVAFSAASIALMFATWGTHRIPVALFHQRDDKPLHLVTYGPYSRIRHPFYTSYLLLFLAAVALFPHWVTLGLLGYQVVTLNITAAGEERRLSASAVGQEYQSYMARTGRFVPRVRTRPARTVPPRQDVGQTAVAVPAEEGSHFTVEPSRSALQDSA